MAHDVETMVFASEDGQPWHFNLTDSRPIETNGLTLAEQVELAKQVCPVLGSTYSLNPVKAVLQDGSTLTVPDTHAVVRDLDGKVLPGTARGQMTLRQPNSIFERLQRIAEGADSTLTAAGYLRDGCRMWVCVKVGTTNPTGNVNDECYRHLVFVTGFDGSLSTQVMCALTRAVCWNTVQICMVETSEADGTKVKVKNTRNAEAKLDAAEETMRKALEKFEIIEKRVKRMAEIRIDASQASKLLDQLLEIESKKTDTGRSRAMAKKERIEALAAGQGMGIDASLQGTVWGLHNAITEYFDHESQVNGVRTAKTSGATTAADASKVLDSLWLGPISKHKAAADVLIDEFMDNVDAVSVQSSL